MAQYSGNGKYYNANAAVVGCSGGGMAVAVALGVAACMAYAGNIQWRRMAISMWRRSMWHGGNVAARRRVVIRGDILQSVMCVPANVTANVCGCGVTRQWRGPGNV